MNVNFNLLIYIHFIKNMLTMIIEGFSLLFTNNSCNFYNELCTQREVV